MAEMDMSNSRGSSAGVVVEGRSSFGRKRSRSLVTYRVPGAADRVRYSCDVSTVTVVEGEGGHGVDPLQVVKVVVFVKACSCVLLLSGAGAGL